MTWLSGPNHRNAVESYDELKDGVNYVTARSAGTPIGFILKKGVLDWETVSPPYNFVPVLHGISSVITAIPTLVASMAVSNLVGGINSAVVPKYASRQLLSAGNKLAS